VNVSVSRAVSVCIASSTLYLGFIQSSLASENDTLISYKTTQTITLDGQPEKEWEKAKPLTMLLDYMPYKPDQYEGMLKTQYSIKSLHDDQNIYFFVQWDDPTKSVDRFPWVKQDDDSWKQHKNLDQTGHENTYYEDKASIFWAINAKGFSKKGCDIACHLADEEGKVADIEQKSAGRKYTRKDGETIDMWHWKAVRTGLTDQFDDQFVDATKDPAANRNWGRKGDSKTGGGYQNNINEDKSEPAYGGLVMNLDDNYVIQDIDKAPFIDTYKPGDKLPGIVVSPFTGSRGDISSKAVWADGKWTLEFQRKLVTTGENAAVEDVQFSDLSETYYFGVSVFDNSQINHIYHEGALKLNFK